MRTTLAHIIYFSAIPPDLPRRRGPRPVVQASSTVADELADTPDDAGNVRRQIPLAPDSRSTQALLYGVFSRSRQTEESLLSEIPVQALQKAGKAIQRNALLQSAPKQKPSDTLGKDRLVLVNSDHRIGPMRRTLQKEPGSVYGHRMGGEPVQRSPG